MAEGQQTFTDIQVHLYSVTMATVKVETFAGINDFVF